MTEHLKTQWLRYLLVLSLFAALVAFQFGYIDAFRYTDLAIRMQDFVTFFLGIMVEALGFVVLGVTVSTLVAVFVKAEWVARYLPRNRYLSHTVVSLLGVLLPVCECGNVPVARRMMLKGFSVSQTITFLLAAPILNPVTFITTQEAFLGFDSSVVWWRMLGAFLIAVGIGLIFSFAKNQSNLLTDQFNYEISCARDVPVGSKFREGLSIFQNEFIANIKMLIIGATFVGFTRVLIPKEAIEAVGSNPVLAVIAMLVLAFVISICSNIDAFVALSYINSFPIGSLLTFLIFGPMIDIKMLSMMRTTFAVKTLGIMTLLVTLGSVAIGLIVTYFT